MELIKSIFVLMLVLLTINKSWALNCYTCSITEDDSDTSCLDNPSAVEGPTRDCDKKYCTIVRIDYKDPRGKLASLVRSCADQVIYANDVIEDETHRAYYRSCRSDLCNGGSGRTESTSVGSGSLGDKSTIYAPGTGGAIGIVSSVLILSLLLMVGRMV